LVIEGNGACDRGPFVSSSSDDADCPSREAGLSPVRAVIQKKIPIPNASIAPAAIQGLDDDRFRFEDFFTGSHMTATGIAGFLQDRRTRVCP
jgi:hypothetical protein